MAIVLGRASCARIYISVNDPYIPGTKPKNWVLKRYSIIGHIIHSGTECLFQIINGHVFHSLGEKVSDYISVKEWN